MRLPSAASASTFRAFARAALAPRLGPGLPPLTVGLECGGSHHEQLDMIARAAMPSGTVLGSCRYAVYGGALHPAMVNVQSAVQRAGIATQLYDAMLAAHPDATLSRGGSRMSDGQAFRAAYDLRRPDRLTPPPRERRRRSPRPTTRGSSRGGVRHAMLAQPTPSRRRPTS